MSNTDSPDQGSPEPDQFSLDTALATKLQKKFERKRKLAPPRKNLYYVIQIVNTFIDMGAEVCTSAELQEAVEELGWREKWNLSPNPIDDNGLRKELAGLVGGCGLHLVKTRGRASNTYRLPTERIDDEFLRNAGINPDLVRKQAIDQSIVNAIRQKRSISFWYRNDPQNDRSRRVVNPHFYGSQSGAVNIEGLQTAGYSSQGNLPDWRVFRLDDIKGLKIHTETFAIWPGYNPTLSKYSQPFEIIK